MPPQNAPDTKNLVLAIALSLVILLGFQTFFEVPREKERLAQVAAERAASAGKSKAGEPTGVVATPGGVAGTAIAAVAQPSVPAQRIAFDSEGVDGTISTLGGRIDDLRLKRYKTEVKAGSSEVTLLQPQGTAAGYYAFFGFKALDGQSTLLPGPNTIWTAPAGAKLTPTTPVTLTHDNGQGLTFARTISVDKSYLFTVTDVVSNVSAAPISVQSYGAVRRHSKPKELANPLVHEGMVGVLDGKWTKMKYPKLEKGERLQTASTGGWFGLADKFWLAALIPDQKAKIESTFEMTKEGGNEIFEARFIAAPQAILAGQSLTTTQHLFAGAKRVDELKALGTKLGLERFEDSVDWGDWEFWLTKPLYAMMMFFSRLVGNNIGLAILIVTVVVKVVTFPLVYSSYKSFARMRDLAPKMAEIKERFAADVPRQQQETMKLYKDEKINPIAGCIPSLLTMPIFFALFKVLSVAIELRHAPFYGWIPDLYAKDPTTYLNLFGLIPFYDPSTWAISSVPIIGGLLMIGAWPILYGISFWLQMKMQPTATDPMQAQIFALMPWMFVFVFASFGSGLVIYYTWSNILTILQQYIIAKTSGNSTPIDEFFAKLGKKKPAAT